MTRQVITSNYSRLSKRHKAIARRIPGAVEDALDEMEQESILMYQKTTRTWKRKPRFMPRRTARGVTVNTDSDIYKWVDFGTRAHDIRAKNAPFLVFRWPYKAATKPRVIASYNARQGDNWARKKSVRHPGIKARNFTDEITKRVQKRAAGIMRRHLEQASNVEAVGI